MRQEVVAGLLLAGGGWVVAQAFHLLAERGYLLGKFLLSGPMLAGVYLAVSPLTLVARPISLSGFQQAGHNALLGLVIGIGVGVGVEIADLFIHERR